MTEFVFGRKRVGKDIYDYKDRKMRSGKDEKKQMDPLFPRLHINDTGKGGPRAPPRNKMALCEEISVTRQRPSSGSITMQTLPLSKDSSLNPSGCQSHVGCPQKNRFSWFCNWPGSLEMAENHHSYSFSSIKFDTRFTNTEIQILEPGNHQKLSSIRPSKMISECHLFRPSSFYNSENSSAKMLGEEDNIRPSYFSQLDRTSQCGHIGEKLENKKLTSLSLSSSGRLQITTGRSKEEVKSTDLKSWRHLENRTNDNHEAYQMRENEETPSPLSIGKKILPDAVVNLLTRNTSDSSTGAPLHQARCNLVNDEIRVHDPCEQSDSVCRTSLENTASTDGIYENLENFSRKRSYSTMGGPSSSSGDTGENNPTLNIKESVNECPTRENDLEVGDAKRRSAISGASVVVSKSGFDISPDDVVGMIGQKLFWKVRRTIAHQQRIFAVQIFELHRLIKVQRLVAKSPEMLSEDILHINRPTKTSPVKKLLAQNIPEATSSLLKPKVDSQRPNLRQETAAEVAHVKLPPLECYPEKGHTTPRSTLRPFAESSRSSPLSSDVKLGSWYFHPGKQWLVPVGSPSEGLVYKPCIAPVHEGCGAPILSRIDREYMSTTYGLPSPSQHSVWLQPCAIPVVDPSNSSKRLPTSRGNDVHGSMVSSSVKRVQGDALSLFPIDPPFQASCKSLLSNTAEMQRIQVIKVVPHNPKLACESAARIFKSIQEERQKHN